MNQSTVAHFQWQQQSPWLCYFPNVEWQCDEATTTTPRHAVSILPSLPKWRTCQQPSHTGGKKQSDFLPAFRAASIEYMFRTVSPLVIQEAQRQVGVVFGSNGVPEDLITVHVRWGDKGREMQLVTMEQYINAIVRLVQQRQQDEYRQRRGTSLNRLGRRYFPATTFFRKNDNIHPNETRVNIYLATEDPVAARAFLQAVPPRWKVYVDVAIEELSSFRPRSIDRHSQPSVTARNTLGRSGLINLASLLVGMEANDYVLTTASSFSRIINSLRTNIVDPRCNNCTRMVDLRPGMW
jgi:hypothetical protein